MVHSCNSGPIDFTAATRQNSVRQIQPSRVWRAKGRIEMKAIVVHEFGAPEVMKLGAFGKIVLTP